MPSGPLGQRLAAGEQWGRLSGAEPAAYATWQLHFTTMGEEEVGPVSELGDAWTRASEMYLACSASGFSLYVNTGKSEGSSQKDCVF